MPDRSQKWPRGPGSKAGYISKGSGQFFIYRRVRGKLYEISTRATSERAALKQLERFEVNPEAYKPEGEAPKGALLLNVDLTKPFLEWSRDVKRNTLKWVRDQKRALVWWEERLPGVDLRGGASLTPRLLAELDGADGQKQKIATLKAFYSWLRVERHVIATAEDPTYGQIRVPQSKPKQLEAPKAIDRAEFERALAALKGWPRDALEVLGGTGWHVTELERFAAGGRVEQHPINGAPVLLTPHTKGGVPLKTQVSQSVAEAASRIREVGSVDYFRLRDALRDAGADFNPGYLRHSVASWAINAGADPAAVAAFLGHRSVQTTKKFYATHAVPAKVPTLGDAPVKPRGRRASRIR